MMVDIYTCAHVAMCGLPDTLIQCTPKYISKHEKIDLSCIIDNIDIHNVCLYYLCLYPRDDNC